MFIDKITTFCVKCRKQEFFLILSKEITFFPTIAFNIVSKQVVKNFTTISEIENNNENRIYAFDLIARSSANSRIVVRCLCMRYVYIISNANL